VPFFFDFVVALLDVLSRFAHRSEETYSKWSRIYSWVELLTNSCWLALGLMAHTGLLQQKKKLQEQRNLKDQKLELPVDHPDLLDETNEIPEKKLVKREKRVNRYLHLVAIKSWKEILAWNISLYSCLRSSYGFEYPFADPIVSSIEVIHGILGFYRLTLRHTLGETWLQ